MNWKTIPWVLGVALLAVSLVAARLMNADTPVNVNPPPPKSSLPPGGLTVLGWVDSLPTVPRIDSPGVMGMPALTIKKVLVEEGEKVEPGQVLVEFDTGSLPHKLTQAKKQLIAAQWKVVEAEAVKADHPFKLELQKLALDTAEKQAKHADDVLGRYKTELERVLQADTKGLTGKPLTEEDKERRRSNDENLNKYTALVTETKANVEKQKIELKRLQAVPVEAPLQQANAVVEQIQAGIAEAEVMIESFKLKAQVAGTVEQVNAVAGMTFGATTRTPLLHLVPSGKRIVHAEVEAEFAYRIDSQRGKTVTICDQHDTTLIYTGTVVRVPSAFLPKRFGGDSLVGNSTRVLECTIEVTDPAPAGKPPLRPGQAVRVVFGQ
jgi:multidrug resistance efflux pump